MPEPRDVASPWSFGGLAGLAGAFFLVAATPTVLDAPWWLTGLLLAGWLGALVLGLAWFTRRPRAVAVLPGLVVLAWFVTVVAGARLLGWG